MSDDFFDKSIPPTVGKLILHAIYCITFLVFVYCITCVAPPFSSTCSPVTPRVVTTHK